MNNATIEVFRSGSRHSEEPEVFEGRTDASADISLFINERFMLDEMTRQNASKFSIFHIYKKVNKFAFSFRATLLFSLMNALVYLDIDRGIH